MDRLNRMLQAAQGMGMGSAAPGGVSGPLRHSRFASLLLVTIYPRSSPKASVIVEYRSFMASSH
jgi:hypothetical protein